MMTCQEHLSRLYRLSDSAEMVGPAHPDTRLASGRWRQISATLDGDAAQANLGPPARRAWVFALSFRAGIIRRLHRHRIRMSDRSAMSRKRTTSWFVDPGFYAYGSLHFQAVRAATGVLVLTRRSGRSLLVGGRALSLAASMLAIILGWFLPTGSGGAAPASSFCSWSAWVPLDLQQSISPPSKPTTRSGSWPRWRRVSGLRPAATT